MSVRSLAILACPLGDTVELAAHLRDHVGPAFQEASDELSPFWETAPAPHEWIGEGPAHAHAHGAWIDREGPFLMVRFSPRWRGLVAMPELREPTRVMAWAIREALGSDEPAIFRAETCPDPGIALPLASRLSKAFVGWDPDSPPRVSGAFAHRVQPGETRVSVLMRIVCAELRALRTERQVLAIEARSLGAPYARLRVPAELVSLVTARGETLSREEHVDLWTP